MSWVFHAMSERSSRTAAHIRDPGNNAWSEYPYYNVSNFHRVVVHGSTTPVGWLRLTVDSNANNKTTDTTFGPFSWARTPQPQL